ncbi:MAG TPA: tetratricopeptide repeat protein [Dongiaceae bacterium]
MLINPLFLNDLFIMFGHASSHGDTPSEHPQRSVNAAENRHIKGKKMVRSTTRLLGTVALCFAASGCALFADTTVKEPKTVDVEPTLRQAAILAERNANYTEAAQHYASLHSKHPEDKAITMALARNLRFAGKPQAAIALLNSTPQTQDAMGLLELGKDYLAADQLNLAKPTLERAKAAAPLNWEILSSLGVVYDYEGNYPMAQQQYDAALFLDPENPTILNNKALSLAQEGKLDEAVTTMQTAIDQPSASAQTRQNLALLMALKGDTDAAERLARKDLPPAVAEANIEYYRSLAKPEVKPENKAQKPAKAATAASEDDDVLPPPPPPVDY